MFGFNKGELVKAYFFTKQRTLLFYEVRTIKEDNGQVFKSPLPNDKGLYVVDFSSVQFFTPDKKPVFFYIEGIPNPLLFDVKKNVSKFINEKREDINKIVTDDNNNVLDLSFSSVGLEMYKNDNFLKKLMTKTTPEQMKIIFALIGALGFSFIAIIVIVIFKR